MKCPFIKIVVHMGESSKQYARDIEEFGDCYKSECPFYANDGCSKVDRLLKDL